MVEEVERWVNNLWYGSGVMAIGFQITARDGHARTGVISTDHGQVQTPTVTVNFTPALLRTGITSAQVQALGVELLLVNTLHAHLADVVDVHQWLGWDGPVIADSGGYQMISLAKKLKTDSAGVTFEMDGRGIRMTPEKVLDIQRGMGIDMMMPLDFVVDVRKHSILTFLSAVLKTERWFAAAYATGKENLFYIVQGGTSSLARSISLWFARRWLDGRAVQAVALGGISLGEAPSAIHKTVEYCCRRLPENKPRHLLGVGRPNDLIQGVLSGVDTFDCVAITREARHGRLWTRRGMLRLTQSQFVGDADVIEQGCGCPTCISGLSRAELRAGLRSVDGVEKRKSQVAAMLHNIWFVQQLMAELREDIRNGQMAKWNSIHID